MYKLPFGVTVVNKGDMTEVHKLGLMIGGYEFDVVLGTYKWNAITGDSGEKGQAKECIDVINDLAK